jgi:hypothetical protein
VIVHIWPIRSRTPAQGRNIRPHAHNARGVAVRAHLSCWAFWSGASIIHVQGTIS